MKIVILILALLIVVNKAIAKSDLLDTVKVTQTLISQGYDISHPVAVETAEQMTIPPLRCVLIVTDRKSNTECPGDIGPHIDKGALGCLDESNNVIKTSHFFNSCP